MRSLFFKKTFFIFLISIGILSAVNFSSAATAAIDDSLLKGIPCAGTGDCTPCSFLKLFINGADLILGLTGTFAIIMFVYGGLVMITAYGNEARITWGKNILIATVTGIFITLLAWLFVNFLISSLYGAQSDSFTNFTGKEWNSTGVCSPAAPQNSVIAPQIQQRIP